MKLVRTRTAGETKTFYADLMAGKVSRGILGKEKRFDPLAIATKDSVQRHFVDKVRPYIERDNLVLDMGCGPGGFLITLAPMVDKLVGVDISASFIELARQALHKADVQNAAVGLVESNRLPFMDDTFDVVILVDTIHHMEDVDKALHEVRRVLKRGGKLLVFEPNILNPMLAAMCPFDQNEYGLVSLGTFSRYRRLLGEGFSIIEQSYSGLLIGPEGRLVKWLADAACSGAYYGLLRWLSPKLFIVARNDKHI